MAYFRIWLVIVIVFCGSVSFINCENHDGSLKQSQDQEATEKSSSTILAAIHQPTQPILRVPEAQSSSSHETHNFTITTQSPPEETTSASAAKPTLMTLPVFENSVKTESDIIMQKDSPPEQQHDASEASIKSAGSINGGHAAVEDHSMNEGNHSSKNFSETKLINSDKDDGTENQGNQSLYAAASKANAQSEYDNAQVRAKGNEREASEKDGLGQSSHDADTSAAYHNSVTEIVKTSDSISYQSGSQNKSQQFSSEPSSLTHSLIPTGETAPVPQVGEEFKTTSHPDTTKDSIGETHTSNSSNKTSALDIATTKNTEIRSPDEIDSRGNDNILGVTTLPLPSEPIEITSKDDKSSDTSIGSSTLTTPSQIDKSSSTEKDGLTSSGAIGQHITIKSKPTDDTIPTTSLNESSINVVKPVSNNVTSQSPSTTEKSWLSNQADNTTDSSPSVHQFFMDLRTHTLLCLVSILVLLLAGTIIFSIILAIYLTFKYCGIGSAMLVRKMSKCVGKKRRGSSHSSAHQDSGSLFPRCDVTLRPYILNNHDSL